MSATSTGARGRRGGMGSHSKPGQGDTDEWYTPPGVFDRLKTAFDLDPCAPPGGVEWVPALQSISIEDDPDGLAAVWSGKVWMNPPYGRATERWMKKLAAHGNGIALVFARTETAWWHETVPAAHAVTFIAGRLTFVRADGAPSTSNAGAPSCLIAYGEENANTIARAGLGMTFSIKRARLDVQASLWEGVHS